MDPLTHAVLGATLAQSFSQPPRGAKRADLAPATLAGLLAALAPDLDTLITSSSDPLLFLEFHRHFTHSLFFAPAGALICALFLWPFYLRGPMSFWRLWCYTFLGYFSHCLLDACTTYGTRLLWPLSQERFSWDIIGIIDPFLTVPFLLLAIFAYVRRSRSWGRLALFLAMVYLYFGVFQRERALLYYKQVVQERQHTPVQMVVKPTVGNLALWRGVYEVGGEYYIDALWVWPHLGSKLYPGTMIKKITVDEDLSFVPKDSVLYRDLKTFEFFSGNMLVFHPKESNVIGDIRYAMIPNMDTPLWGIRVNLNQTDQHVKFEYFRKITWEALQSFYDMTFEPFFSVK